MTAVDAPNLLRADTGPAPETAIVRDLAKRALPAIPVVLAVAGLVAGTDGVLSAGVAVALVLVNFAVAALSLAWAARISLALLMGVSLFGYVLRLGLLFAAVFVLRDLDWVHLPSLGVTLVVTHLGLLAWELRYVSASLAHPALKPTTTSPAVRSTTPSTDDKEPIQ